MEKNGLLSGGGLKDLSFISHFALLNGKRKDTGNKVKGVRVLVGKIVREADFAVLSD